LLKTENPSAWTLKRVISVRDFRHLVQCDASLFWGTMLHHTPKKGRPCHLVFFHQSFFRPKHLLISPTVAFDIAEQAM